MRRPPSRAPGAGSACVGYVLIGAGACEVQFRFLNGDLAYSRSFGFSETADCCEGFICSELPRDERWVVVH